jgi:hypothetical protein
VNGWRDYQQELQDQDEAIIRRQRIHVVVNNKRARRPSRVGERAIVVLLVCVLALFVLAAVTTWRARISVAQGQDAPPGVPVGVGPRK